MVRMDHRFGDCLSATSLGNIIQTVSTKQCRSNNNIKNHISAGNIILFSVWAFRLLIYSTLIYNESIYFSFSFCPYDYHSLFPPDMLGFYTCIITLILKDKRKISQPPEIMLMMHTFVETLSFLSCMFIFHHSLLRLKMPWVLFFEILPLCIGYS